VIALLLAQALADVAPIEAPPRTGPLPPDPPADALPTTWIALGLGLTLLLGLAVARRWAAGRAAR
jgi:hypothetical protein